MQSIQASISILKDVKDLVAPSNPWIPVIAAVLGALAGGMAPLIVKTLESSRDRKANQQAVAHQIYAEISAILEIVNQRKYLDELKRLRDVISINPTSSFYMVQISEAIDPLYKANIDKLPLLAPELQTKIVMFYRYLNALVEDIKPGGTFNTAGATCKGIDQFLVIADQAILIGNQIKVEIAKQFKIGDEYQ